eukprot:scaffold22578_cov164-Cylindrotheca_fusiformis.AAC.9
MTGWMEGHAFGEKGARVGRANGLEKRRTVGAADGKGVVDGAWDRSEKSSTEVRSTTERLEYVAKPIRLESNGCSSRSSYYRFMILLPLVDVFFVFWKDGHVMLVCLV